MPIVAFISSLSFCSLVLSFVDSRSDSVPEGGQFDYHYVPYGGNKLNG